MAIDPWLPRGYVLSNGVVLLRCVLAEQHWQIYETRQDGRVVVADEWLAKHWVSDGLLEASELAELGFGSSSFLTLVGGARYRLGPVGEDRPPDDFTDCQAFVAALGETRRLSPQAALHDAIYVERLSRLLPCHAPAPGVEDSVLVGGWITGGVPVSIFSTRRMRSLVPWLSENHLSELRGSLLEHGPEVRADEEIVSKQEVAAHIDDGESRSQVLDHAEHFRLPGRPALESFFNEHVIDIVRNEERYRALGIRFPGAILLWGPPGCGKTFAVERLVEFLDWPVFMIDAKSIGSPYIHETGRKIATVFEDAAKASPSVVVLDEIDAFLAARDTGAGGQHRAEEVAEFLRSIPKAVEDKVLVVGMTNRLDSLDPAVVRRGRFDHVLEVGMPGEHEVQALLVAQITGIPADADLDLASMAKALAGRPLSDVGFIIREACRLAARAARDRVGAAEFEAAIAATPSRSPAVPSTRKIGFV